MWSRHETSRSGSLYREESHQQERSIMGKMITETGDTYVCV